VILFLGSDFPRYWQNHLLLSSMGKKSLIGGPASTEPTPVLQMNSAPAGRKERSAAYRLKYQRFPFSIPKE